MMANIITSAARYTHQNCTCLATVRRKMEPNVPGILSHINHLSRHVEEGKKKYAVSTRWEREVAEHGSIDDFHQYFCCCARRLGNMFILCERADGSPIVIAGPCWPFCSLVTLPLILAVSGAVSYFFIISPNSPLVSFSVSSFITE